MKVDYEELKAVVDNSNAVSTHGQRKWLCVWNIEYDWSPFYAS
jgi:hypothetical protein